MSAEKNISTVSTEEKNTNCIEFHVLDKILNASAAIFHNPKIAQFVIKHISLIAFIIPHNHKVPIDDKIISEKSTDIQIVIYIPDEEPVVKYIKPECLSVELILYFAKAPITVEIYFPYYMTGTVGLKRFLYENLFADAKNLDLMDTPETWEDAEIHGLQANHCFARFQIFPPKIARYTHLLEYRIVQSDKKYFLKNNLLMGICEFKSIEISFPNFVNLDTLLRPGTMCTYHEEFAADIIKRCIFQEPKFLEQLKIIDEYFPDDNFNHWHEEERELKIEPIYVDRDRESGLTTNFCIYVSVEWKNWKGEIMKCYYRIHSDVKNKEVYIHTITNLGENQPKYCFDNDSTYHVLRVTMIKAIKRPFNGNDFSAEIKNAIMHARYFIDRDTYGFELMKYYGIAAGGSLIEAAKKFRMRAAAATENSELFDSAELVDVAELE